MKSPRYFDRLNVSPVLKFQFLLLNLTSAFLQTPQTPIVRTKTYEKYNIDDCPLGTNAIVAVLAYSG